jgi:hypothetical protein
MQQKGGIGQLNKALEAFQALAITAPVVFISAAALRERRSAPLRAELATHLGRKRTLGE